MKKDNWNNLNVITGVMLVVSVLLLATIVNEVTSFFVLKKLEKQFETQASRVTTLSELDQLTKQYSIQKSEIVSVKDLFRNSAVSFNTSAASEGNATCEEAIHALLEGREFLDELYAAREVINDPDFDSSDLTDEDYKEFTDLISQTEGLYQEVLSGYFVHCVLPAAQIM